MSQNQKGIKPVGNLKMTDKHSAEFFSNAHFWVIIDLFAIYYSPMQQRNQKIQYSMKNFAFFYFIYTGT